MKAHLYLMALAVAATSCAATSPLCPPTNDPMDINYFPHPKDCQKFLTCSFGNEVEFTCPEGTYWNDPIKSCDHKQNVDCPLEAPSTSTESTTPELTTVVTTITVGVSSDAPFTTTPSTTTSGTTAPGGKCPEEFDPDHQAFLPHTDCTKFYICTWGGVAVEKNCPAGLHWNQNANYCDYPQQAGCVPTSTGSTAETPTPTTTEVPSTTTESTTPEPTTTVTTTVEVTSIVLSTTTLTTTTSGTTAPAGKCPEVFDPDHQAFLPHPDCTKFYICTWGGVAVEKDCPAGLHWNQHANVCDHPQQAGCVPSSTGSTAEPLTTSTTKVTSTTTESTTPESTTASVTTTTVEVTSDVPATTTLTTTTSGTTTPAGKCPEAFDPEHQVFLPHADCTKFYICTWGGAAVEKDCPAGLHWNPNANYCDYPQQAGCVPTSTGSTAGPTDTSTTEVPLSTTTLTTPEPTTTVTTTVEVTSDVPATTTTTTTTSGTTAPAGKCPEVYDPDHQAFLPHVDCTKYYICTWGGVAVEQNCPAGLHWNQHANVCDYPQQAGCIPTSTGSTAASTAEVPATTLTTAPPPAVQSEKCPEQFDVNHQVFLSHADCTKFYICTWGGVAVQKDCPAGLHWNQHSNICDYPQQAGCVSTSTDSTAGPTTSVTSEAPLSTTAAPEVPSDDRCPEHYDPNHQVYFPHTDCRKYYICTYEGSKLEQNCPAGLHWSQTLSYCEVPAVAQCA